jgi:capsular polysaccharide biosynthesis protein
MFTEYLRMIVRRWWLVLIPVIALAVFSLISYRAPAVSYKVTMRFAAGLPPERASGVFNYERYYSWLTSEYMANGFADVARTSIFAQNVADRVSAQGMSVTADVIQGAISSDQKQSIMVIYLTWPDAAQAVKIGDAISAEFAEHGLTYWPQISSAGSAPVVQLDRPVPVAFVPSLRDRFDLPVRFILALVVGVALALIAHFLDPFVHDRRELEHLGMRVIVDIPNAKR